MPQGKRNSFASSCLPEFVLVTLRTKGCNVNLANSFIIPVAGEDLVGQSIKRLSDHWDKLTKCFPEQAAPSHFICVAGQENANKNWANVENIDNLLNVVGEAVNTFFESEE